MTAPDGTRPGPAGAASETAPGGAARRAPAAATRAGATQGPARSLLGATLLCFLLSGATGLIYQVIWLRMLGLVFGHTVYAITTVLAAFMAGLALGSHLFARWAARFRRPLAAYGWLELAIGVSCGLVPLLLWAGSEAYLELHAAFGLSYDTFSVLQFVLAFGLLLVPTTLMGGTLPVLSQALVAREAQLGRTVGTLYAVNTFGAVAGTLGAGYLLLPALGNLRTTACAVAANLLVGVIALLLSRRLEGHASAAAAPEAAPGPGRARAPAPASDSTGPTTPAGRRLAVLALGLSGAVSMLYEICFTRGLSLVIGSSTYAFTAMLVAFLVGIALGSALYSWGFGARRPSLAQFGLLQAGIGLAAASCLAFFDRLPEWFLRLLAATDLGSVSLVQLVVSALALLPFTLLIGATFPCVVALAARRADQVGRDVGRIYAVNTLGAIGGSLAAGFLLVPLLGVQRTIQVGAAGNLGLAALSLLPRFSTGVRSPARRGLAVALTLAAGAGVFLLPGWDLRLMTSGSAIYARTYIVTGPEQLSETLASQEVVFYADGKSGTVSVTRDGEHYFLRVNGKLDAGSFEDMPTQLLSGHIPMLAHGAARDVLVIGMGSGITAGAVLAHPVERLDIVEIEPAVIEATRFFAAQHGGVLEDPRTRTYVADGRNLLLTTSAQYDVIVSEPSNPWIGGLASLFSTEFFALARDHLRPDGLMLQWLQGYNLFPDDMRMVVSTFRTAFPCVTIWNSAPGDYLLLGSQRPLLLDLPRLAEQWAALPGLRAHGRSLGWSGVAALCAYFRLGDADSERFAAGAGTNSDDRLPLEFSAPRALYEDTLERNRQLVSAHATSELPPLTPASEALLGLSTTWRELASGHSAQGDAATALRLVEHALQLQPDDELAALDASVALLQLGRPQDAYDRALLLLARRPDDPRALYLAGISALALGRHADALQHLDRAAALDAGNPLVQEARRRAQQPAPSPSGAGTQR